MVCFNQKHYFSRLNYYKVINFFKNNSLILVAFIVFVIVSIPVLSIYSKDEIHIIINKNNNPFFDFFFKYITHLGNGIFVIVVGFVLALIKYRYAIFVIGSYLFSSLIVQFLKKIIYSDVIRPVKYFQGIYDLHLINGVEMHHAQSFPSGHTATAFALFFFLAFISKNKLIKIFYFFMALLIAYSRMYLSLHFYIDVYAGAIIGVVCTLIIYIYMQTLQLKWLDLSLLKKTGSGNDKK